MSLCSSIETLAMAYLDDELAPEERRELELHLPGCASCKQHLEAERAELSFVRKALVAPPAPKHLHVSIQKLLDAEDREAARTMRRGFMQWLLPGAATLAAAAAIAAFVFVKPPQEAAPTRVVQDAVRQQTRGLPMEVSGPSTGPWLRTHFAAVEPPQFAPGLGERQGARLTSVAGHEAALIEYRVTRGDERFKLHAIMMLDMRPGDLSSGDPIRYGDRVLYLASASGVPVVTYVDEHNTGYIFGASGRLSPQELIELVVSTDLIGRAQQGR